MPPRENPTILRMAAPLVVSFWMRSLFAVVDTFYAGTIGDTAVAAIGLTLPSSSP
jgi:Na+-driven multidrug efflux pump